MPDMHNLSWVFSQGAPNEALWDGLFVALERGFLDWVCIPLLDMAPPEPEALESDVVLFQD